MTNYEKLCQESFDVDVDIVDYPFNSERIKGLYCDGTIALNSSIETNTEKYCILAEELGHHYTATGNILDQSTILNRKQEQRGRIWAYNKLIGLNGIVNCFQYGCRSKSEIAEFLGVTEEFLQEALCCYHQKYGLYAQLDNYVIYFEPLSVLELYEAI